MERTPDSAAHWQRYVPGGESMKFRPGCMQRLVGIASPMPLPRWTYPSSWFASCVS
jgi:hypothetical protein